MDRYEQRTLQEIRRWRRRGGTHPAVKLLDRLSGPFGAVVGRALSVPPIERTFGTTLDRALALGNRLAQLTVSDERVRARFSEHGHEVRTRADIEALPLRAVDDVAGDICEPYRYALAAEGAGTGLAGTAGLVIDLPTVVVGTLRAIGEHAATYGFDPRERDEQLFALLVLGIASTSGDTRAELLEAATELATETGSADHRALARTVANGPGARLVRSKVGSSFPLVGSVFGAGYNAVLAHDACQAARMLYRQRFLARRHGTDAAFA